MIQIPPSELDFSFARSSGPGGQNVNKVNSKAVLRWSVVRSGCLAEETRAKLLSRLASQLTREGEVLITCDEYRDQLRNRERCLEKLYQLLTLALREPKNRKKTRPSRSSVRKHKESKRRNSEKKALRKSPFR